MADGFVPSYQNEEERREEIKQNNKKYRIRTILLSVLFLKFMIMGELILETK